MDEAPQTDRRGTEEDRRSVTRGTPDRRKPGRPPKPDKERPTVRTVKLSPELDETICRIAARQGITVHAALIAAVRRLADLENRVSGSSKTPPPSHRT